MTNDQHRRANGVYYTPTYVVNYIVHHTLQPLLERGERNELRPIRVVDPACGAGIFLQQAYQYLLDVHLKWYLDREPQQVVRDVVAKLQRDSDGGWELNVAERQRILLDCMYGVDIDSRAIETAKTTLASIALQNQHVASPATGESKLRDQLTAGLAANIRCGDALVSPDLGDQSLLEADSPSAGLAAFDWQTEFSPITRGGEAGFDAVIGNPPYVNIRRLTRSHGSAMKDYFQRHYRCARGAYDLYVLFLEKAWQLLRPGGMCGMIVPNKVATLDYAMPCRAMLLHDTALHRITDVSQLRVFPDAGIYPYILTWQKTKPLRDHRVTVVHASSPADLVEEPPAQYIRQAELSAQRGLCVHGKLDVETRVATESLGQVARIHSGTTGFVAQQIADALKERTAIGDVDGECFPFIVSGNIDRYRVKLGQVRFMKRDFDQPLLEAATDRLTDNKRQLFRGPKIVLAGMTRRLEAALDSGGLALGVQVYAVNHCVYDFRYLLALLNSQLLSYLFRIRFQAKRLAGGYLAINKGQLSQLPIPILDLHDRGQRLVYQTLIDLVDRIHDLHAAIECQPCAAKRIDVQQQIKDTDREIDAHVFRLYDLTPIEIAEVEARVDAGH